MRRVKAWIGLVRACIGLVEASADCARDRALTNASDMLLQIVVRGEAGCARRLSAPALLRPVCFAISDPSLTLWLSGFLPINTKSFEPRLGQVRGLFM